MHGEKNDRGGQNAPPPMGLGLMQNTSYKQQEKGKRSKINL